MSAARVAVAYSGGRDSTALLHATARAAAGLRIEVLALHVHHGLHDDADAWLAHCRRTCRRWRLPLAVTRLEGAPSPGASVEAWARTERWAALAAMARAHDATLVLLGQHRRDQAETFMLQALRGGGLAGLAAMPARFERDGLVWARPWLQQPRESIEAYLRRHRLRYIDDASNTDRRFARNRLRLDVWPTLAAAFPDAEAAFADAAMRVAQGAELVDELAADDLDALVVDGALDAGRWQTLSPPRRRHALLLWLRRHGRAAAALVDRLLAELPGARSGCWPAGDATELRLYRGRLGLHRQAEPVAERPASTLLHIDGAGRYPLPGWGGCLRVCRVERGGVEPARLTTLRVLPRGGGERFALTPSGAARPLKKQYQSRGVPAWQREGPLLYDGERLLFVPGLGIDARMRAGVDVPLQFALDWEPGTGR